MAFPVAAVAANGTTYVAGTPAVDQVSGAPWNPSQGLSTSSFGAGTFNGSSISAYPSSDLLPMFSFGGPTTSSANSTTEPNVATYPAASGDEPFPSGFAGTPGPLSGYCGSSYSDSWDTSATATSGNPNETSSPVSEPSGESLPFSPYYFPDVVLNSDGTLTGYFDYRPKDADEEIHRGKVECQWRQLDGRGHGAATRTRGTAHPVTPMTTARVIRTSRTWAAPATCTRFSARSVTTPGPTWTPSGSTR